MVDRLTAWMRITVTVNEDDTNVNDTNVDDANEDDVIPAGRPFQSRA